MLLESRGIFSEVEGRLYKRQRLILISCSPRRFHDQFLLSHCLVEVLNDDILGVLFEPVRPSADHLALHIAANALFLPIDLEVYLALLHRVLAFALGVRVVVCAPPFERLGEDVKSAGEGGLGMLLLSNLDSQRANHELSVGEYSPNFICS